MILNDDIYQLKEDLDECIINDSNFEGKYNFFIFDKQTMQMANGLGCFDTLNISLEDNCIKLKGEIAKDIKQNVDLDKMKSRVEEKHKRNLMQQLIENNKTEEEKMEEYCKGSEEILKIIEESEEDAEVREITTKDKIILLSLQDTLKQFNLNLQYEETEEVVMLNGVYNDLNFNKYQLREIISLLQTNIDFFTIVPYFKDEDDENAVGIRIAIGISLAEEEV